MTGIFTPAYSVSKRTGSDGPRRMPLPASGDVVPGRVGEGAVGGCGWHGMQEARPSALFPAVGDTAATTRSATPASQVPVDRGAADPEGSGDHRHRVLPGRVQLPRHPELVAVIIDGRPPPVRSRTTCARTRPARRRHARPACRWGWWCRPTPAGCRTRPRARPARPAVSTRWRGERPSRSSFEATRASPGRSWSRTCSRTGRSVSVPLVAAAVG